MKKLLALFALMVIPQVAWSQQQATGMMNEMFVQGPVSAKDETWAARTDINATYYDSSTRAFYALDTIQPLYRSDMMNHTLFAQGGLGARKIDKNAEIGLGLGYRYLTPSNYQMFDLGMLYRDRQNGCKRKDSFGYSAGWHTQYTSLWIGTYEKERHHWKTGNWDRMFNLNKAMTALDFGFQFPFLPWTFVNVGYSWRHNHFETKWNKIEYRIDMYLAGPLMLQFGKREDWKKSGFVRLVANFGRPAYREYTLANSIFGDSMFTARNLKDYTLYPISRFRVD